MASGALRLNPFLAPGTAFGRPVPRPGAGRLPVTVVTGFLGAGKTSLIRGVLRDVAAADTALIVNEFGEVGVDDVLLRASGETTMLIGNGCVCCAASTDLHRTLRDLFADRVRGAVPSFRRVIVETSGLADPTPVLQALATDRSLGECYGLNGVVTVIDAATGLASAEQAPEWSRQVALADRIVLTKADLASPATVAALRTRIAACNTLAPVEVVNPAVPDPALLLDDGFALSAVVAEPVPAGHASAYRSFVVEREAPVDADALRESLDVLATLLGTQVLRVKGLVRIAGLDGPVVVHRVQHLAHPVEALAQWPGARRTRLVFITRGDIEARVRALLAAVWDLVPAPQTAGA